VLVTRAIHTMQLVRSRLAAALAAIVISGGGCID